MNFDNPHNSDLSDVPPHDQSGHSEHVSPPLDHAQLRVISPSTRAVSRIVGGQALILDATHDEIRQLNEVGSFLWSLIVEASHTYNDILERLIAEFEVTRELARSDLDGFIEELESLNLIERS